VSTLSEAASKRLLAGHGVPVLDEREAGDADGAVAAAEAIGYPVVVKLCGDAIAHNIEGVATAAAATTTAASQAQEAAGELATMAQELSALVGRFTVS